MRLVKKDTLSSDKEDKFIFAPNCKKFTRKYILKSAF